MALGASPHDLNRRLRRIVEAFAVRGIGPAEADVADALATGDSTTLRAAVAGLETLYPPDLRVFLDQRGLGRLYRDDLGRAVRRLEATPIPSGKRSRGSGGPGRAALWLLVLASVGLVGALSWRLSDALPEPVVADPPPPVAGASPPAEPIIRPMEPVCRARLKAMALSWCARSLAGPDGSSETPDWAGLAECGDALDLSSDAVRTALDGLFQDGAAETYGRAEIASRCERAAELAMQASERAGSDGPTGSRRP